MISSHTVGSKCFCTPKSTTRCDPLILRYLGQGEGGEGDEKAPLEIALNQEKYRGFVEEESEGEREGEREGGSVQVMPLRRLAQRDHLPGENLTARDARDHGVGTCSGD